MPRSQTVTINRAPVLTLWAAVVAERLGFDWDEALTLGRAVAGLNAYSKGVRLGLFEPTPKEVKAARETARAGSAIHVALLGRAVPCVQTQEGVRALEKEKPAKPESVQRYLDSKFGAALADARVAMQALAKSMPPASLATEAFHLYEQFRPSTPADTQGWGAKGELDLALIRRMAQKG
ncbi:MAG: hypothetical protein R3D05_06620 [Dongiaceae bacterium]